ncbi:hypothetical protein LA080_005749 [Diaporthe eres]|uniref:FAD-binding domain-containing protein n=1 Tax=Diaporthe vaccinii TaxID=105482 RepID=A0ABR4EB92_9PEZI|nr:hypothetical protein LA080_005749 [Diaporthe eres]
MTPPPPPHIAIIGAGITGLTLAAGLHAREIPFTVYERATAGSNGSGGAGIGLSPNAERAMALLSPRVRAAYEAVANPNGEDYFQWVDGLSRELIFRLFVGEGCFRGCRRGDFVDGLMGCVPEGSVRFGRVLREVVEVEGGEGVRLLFEDGTEEVADAVIGCDGIRSRVRELLFGPSSAATYSKKYSFRALIPMPQARASLPEHMITTRFMYNGPGAHVITYPVANNTMLNTLAVVSDPEPWEPPPQGSKRNPHVGSATLDEAAAAFGDWHPDIRAIVGLLPAEMDKWAIFDMLEHPVPRYHGGGGSGGGATIGGGGSVVCLAGDAAHACGPHLGAGAGFGIEDALVLAELIQAVRDADAVLENGRGDGGGDKRTVGARLATAFEVYSDVRYGRTQWLVKHTRDAVDLFQWRDRALSRSADDFDREITWRFHEIWHHDTDKMVEEARQKLRAR